MLGCGWHSMSAQCLCASPSAHSMHIHSLLSVLLRKRAVKDHSAYPVISCMGWQACRLEGIWDLGCMAGS